MRELCKNVNIPLFSACCFFFHFANAAVLPLLGQYAAIVGPHVPIGVAPHGHVAPMPAVSFHVSGVRVRLEFLYVSQ